MARIIIETPFGKYMSLEETNREIKRAEEFMNDQGFKLNYISIDTVKGTCCFPKGIYQNSVITFEYDDE